MTWTPLSGARFEDTFGPVRKSRSRVRQRRDDRRSRSRPAVENLEARATPAVTMSIVSSSLASTADPNAAIGEVVRLRIKVTENLTGNFDPTGFNIQGGLGSGWSFMPGSAAMALVSDSGMNSTLDPTNSNGLNVVGNDANVDSITPTFLLPASAITSDPSTGALIFNTGIASANDTDANNEFILIEFNALVNNVAGNQAEIPTTLTSSFTLFVGGQTCNCTGSASVNVVEPTITDLAKNVVVSGDHQSATYTLTFSNTGNSIAYDVRVLDNLPQGLTLDTASVQVVGGSGVVNQSTSTSLDIAFDAIAIGGSVTITYVANIDPAYQNGQTITNIVNLDYTSLPGPNGTTPNPTGSNTPGAPGEPDGKRDGSGGVNDYFDSATASITVSPSGPNSISGWVFGDTDHSGYYTPGDALLAGAVISILDMNGNPVVDVNGNIVAPQTTGADGAFSFINLPDGVYQLIEDYDEEANGYTDGLDFPGLINGVPDTTAQTDPSPPGDRIFNISLQGGAVGTQYLFGECPCPVTINGYIYLDSNRNCIKDPGEPGLIGNVQLTDLNGNPVYDASGNLVPVIQTDANGFYQFLNLAPGAYRVTQLPPQPTYQNQPTLDGCDVAGTVNGVTRGTALNDVITNIVLTAGENSINNDFGEVLGNISGISLSGHVYWDKNNNCIFEPTDAPIAGAVLHLIRTDLPNGPVEVAQTTTNDRGEYFFSIDVAGTYMVIEEQPAGYLDGCDSVGTVNGVLNGSAPQNDTLVNIVLVDGDAGVNYDFGEIRTGMPSKQDLLATSGGSGVGGSQVFPTSPSFTSIDRLGGTTIRIMAVGAAAGAPPSVRVFDFSNGTQLFNFVAYDPTFVGGVRVAVGDVNGDGVADIITAAGVGGGPHIKVFNGVSGALLNEFFAYDASFAGGVYVTAADVDGDGMAEIVTGAGAGGGPHVKIFNALTSAEIASFFAYGANFAGGVNVAGSDFNADGKVDIVTGAGPGGGPHVRIFNSASLGIVGTAPGLLSEFFAFDGSYTGGVTVGANSAGSGDMTGDGRPDLIAGANTGRVRVFDGVTFALASDLVAFDPSLAKNGISTGAFDLNGDGRADIVAGSSNGAFVRVIDLVRGRDLEFFQAFDPTSIGGAFVAAN